MSSSNGSAGAAATKMESLESRQLFSAAVSGTDVLAQISSSTGLRTLEHWISKHPAAALTRSIDLTQSKQLFRDAKSSTLQLKLASGTSPASAIKLLKAVNSVKWASPNFIYDKPKAELTPNDPRLPQQIGHLNRIEAPAAWDTTLGRGVLVAVLDDGVDIDHNDLAPNIWTNTGEIAGNAIDDDNNGYIDDTNGWDFGSNDNNARPMLNQQYNFVDSHGTLVAGIIGAVMNNNIGTAGIAAGAKIMPIRFTGYGVTVTSAGIAQSLAYAVNNGAKVINISFSIDPYMNDPAFAAATDLVHTKGAIWLNSAGNSNVANPPRLTIEKALFVANTNLDDTRFASSNFGDGIDLSAPGVSVQSTVPNNAYQNGTGTSFSTAIASGVTALVWAAHPTWTRDQVAAQVVGMVDSIGTQNPTLIGQLGTGRVNALQGVTGTLAAPKLRGLKGIAANATLASAPSTLTLNLFNILDGATVTPGAFALKFAGADTFFGTADDAIIPLTLTSTYFYGTNQLIFTLPAGLANGPYRFTAKSTITDPFGQALDGNGDGTANGTAGDDFVTSFTLNVPPPAIPNAPGNLVATTPSYSDSEAVLTWTDNATDETGYVIERSSSPTFATIDKTMNAIANSNRYNDWGLAQGSTYYYRIKAVNNVGPSTPTNTATLAIPLPPPGIPNAPTSFVANTPGYSLTEVELLWTDASNNETGFVIERSTSSTFATIDKTINPIANSNRYNDWSLTVGQQYHYRIRSVNGTDASDWVLRDYVAPVPTTPPAAPSGLLVSPVAWSTTEAEVKWSDNSIDETSFTIERALTDDFADATAITASAATGLGQYNVWGLSTGSSYYFRVRAVNAAGLSAWSGTTILALP